MLIYPDALTPSHFPTVKPAGYFIWPFFDLNKDFIAWIMLHTGLAAQSITAEIYHRRMLTKTQLYVFKHNRSVFIIPEEFSIHGVFFH